MILRVSSYIILTYFAYAVIDHGTSHMLELAQLAEKDPEFYKYLQENDRELLEFTTTPDGDDEMDDEDDVMDEDDNEEEIGEGLPVLTTGILKTWQKALLEVNYISSSHHTCT
jgi:nucleolar complex protein 2